MMEVVLRLYCVYFLYIFLKLFSSSLWILHVFANLLILSCLEESVGFFNYWRNKPSAIVLPAGNLVLFYCQSCAGWTDKDDIHQAWSSMCATKKSLPSWYILCWRIAEKWRWKYNKPSRQYCWSPSCSLHPKSVPLWCPSWWLSLLWCIYQYWKLSPFYVSFCPPLGVFYAKFCVCVL